MAPVSVREKRRGEHLDAAYPLALATFLADLDLVAALVHAEQAPAGCAAVGILGLDLNSKLQGVTRLKKRKLTFGESLISNEEIGSDLLLPVLYDLLIE